MFLLLPLYFLLEREKGKTMKEVGFVCSKVRGST